MRLNRRKRQDRRRSSSNGVTIATIGRSPLIVGAALPPDQGKIVVATIVLHGRRSVVLTDLAEGIALSGVRTNALTDLAEGIAASGARTNVLTDLAGEIAPTDVRINVPTARRIGVAATIATRNHTSAEARPPVVLHASPSSARTMTAEVAAAPAADEAPSRRATTIVREAAGRRARATMIVAIDPRLADPSEPAVEVRVAAAAQPSGPAADLLHEAPGSAVNPGTWGSSACPVPRPRSS